MNKCIKCVSEWTSALYHHTQHPVGCYNLSRRTLSESQVHLGVHPIHSEASIPLIAIVSCGFWLLRCSPNDLECTHFAPCLRHGGQPRDSCSISPYLVLESAFSESALGARSVAVCCSVLQCVLQCVGVCVAVCWSVCWSVLQCVGVCVAVCWSVCCSVLEWIKAKPRHLQEGKNPQTHALDLKPSSCSLRCEI